MALPAVDPEYLAAFELESQLSAGETVRQKLDLCTRGVYIVNDSPATLLLRIGTGNAGASAVRLVIYPYSWQSAGLHATRFTCDVTGGAVDNGQVQLVSVDRPLPWESGQLRGSEGLTIRDPVSGNYSGQSTTTAQPYVLQAPSGEVMFWNTGSTTAYLNFNGTAATGGTHDLAVQAGSMVELGVTVSAVSVYGAATYGLEVWR